MRQVIAKIQCPSGKIIEAPLKLLDPIKSGWYLTDITLGEQKQSMQYSKNLLRKHTWEQEGWRYMGKETTYTDGGNYRIDGSILYTNENAAYRRIVYNTKAWGNEEMGVISDGFVLVLPSWGNKSSEADFTEYNYIPVNGNVTDAVSGTLISTVAIIHTHPDGTMPSGVRGDGDFMARHFPYKPNYVLMMKETGSVGISFIISDGTIPFSWQSGYSESLTQFEPNMTYQNIISGKSEYSLIRFTKNNLFKIKQRIP